MINSTTTETPARLEIDVSRMMLDGGPSVSDRVSLSDVIRPVLQVRSLLRPALPPPPLPVASQSRHQAPSLPPESSHGMHGHLVVHTLSIPISPDLPRLCCIMPTSCPSGLQRPTRILSRARATRNSMVHRAQLCLQQRVLAAQAE